MALFEWVLHASHLFPYRHTQSFSPDRSKSFSEYWQLEIKTGDQCTQRLQTCSARVLTEAHLYHHVIKNTNSSMYL